MPLPPAPAPALNPSSNDDSQAIAALHIAFDAQRRAFAADRSPDLEARKERISRIIPMMLGARERISTALAADFGAHPAAAADLIETLGVVGCRRATDAGLLGTARAYIQSQPKGVVGNIVPWNFPFDIGVGPMVEMLAAGNRVILKPSEYAPACAALLREIVAAHFEPELVYVAVGGLELAQAFAALPWNHLLYTGSPDVGRKIMAAAAANLTPVTLELGGKCPAVILPGDVTSENVKSIIGTKIVKNGQMCVSVDYALVPRGELETFASMAGQFMHDAAPGYADGPDCTGIISLRHMERLEAMLEEARDRQSRIVVLEPDAKGDRETRRMPMSLVLDPALDLRMMKEEIFGPILPVVGYDTLEDAMAFINDGERPLGLYVLGDDEAAVARVLAGVVCGGAAVNTCAVQGALPSLAFGGVGMSGMGRHHGEEGFREFSNPRGVVVRGEGDHIDAFFAPYAKAAAIVEHVLTAAA